MLPAKCPLCTYDLTGAPRRGATILCPECGCDTRVEYQKFLQRRQWLRRTALVISGPQLAALMVVVLLVISGRLGASGEFCLGLASFACLGILLWAVFGPLFWWSYHLVDPEPQQNRGRARWILLLSMANIAFAVLACFIFFRGLVLPRI